MGFNQIDRRASCATPSAANYSAIGLLYIVHLTLLLRYTQLLAGWLAHVLNSIVCDSNCSSMLIYPSIYVCIQYIVCGTWGRCFRYLLCWTVKPVSFHRTSSRSSLPLLYIEMYNAKTKPRFVCLNHCAAYYRMV